MSNAAPTLVPVEGTGAAETPDTFDVSAVIAKFQDKLLQPVPQADAPAPAAEPAPAAPAPTPAPAPVAAPAPTPAAAAPAPEPAPAEEEGYRAKQLAALAKLQAKLDSERQQMQGQLQSAREQTRAEMRELFLRDPVAFVEQAQVPQDRLSAAGTLLLGAALGEDAPQEVRDKIERLRLKARLDAIEQGQQARQREAEREPTADFRAQVAATDREIQALTRSVPSDMPFLAAEAQDSPQEVHQALCQIAAPIIKAGRWPSAHEVAQALETQLRSEYERLARVGNATSQKSASSTQPPPSTQKVPPTTLSDADVAARPARGPEGLLSDDEYRKRALKVATEQGLLRRT